MSSLVSHPSYPDSDSSDDANDEPNWELLSETLSPEALEQLRKTLAERGAPTASPVPTEEPTSATRGGHLPLPASNTAYGEHQYWEDRFEKEEEFDWLVNYPQIEKLIKSKLDMSKWGSLNVLLVGCGNSTFSYDLFKDGVGSVTSLDYSEVVILAMREKHPETDTLKWVVGDMTALDFPPGTFDVVIDKAAMDALMVNEGDVWNPDDDVVAKARSMCKGISDVLKDGGIHLHISFAQPHFRRKYLLGLHGENTEGFNTDEYSKEFGWGCTVEAIEGEDGDGCFHHFFYTMVKDSVLV